MRKFLLGAMCLVFLGFNQVFAEDMNALKTSSLSNLFAPYNELYGHLFATGTEIKLCDDIPKRSDADISYSCDLNIVITENKSTGVIGITELLNPKWLLHREKLEKPGVKAKITAAVDREWAALSSNYTETVLSIEDSKQFAFVNEIALRNAGEFKNEYEHSKTYVLPKPLNATVNGWILDNIYGELDHDTQNVIDRALTRNSISPEDDNFATPNNENVGAVVQTLVDANDADRITRRILITTDGKDFNGYQFSAEGIKSDKPTFSITRLTSQGG